MRNARRRRTVGAGAARDSLLPTVSQPPIILPSVALPAHSKPPPCGKNCQRSDNPVKRNHDLVQCGKGYLYPIEEPCDDQSQDPGCDQ